MRAIPLNISTTAERARTWRLAARAADLSLSAWVRRHLDRAARLEAKGQPGAETLRRGPQGGLSYPADFPVSSPAISEMDARAQTGDEDVIAGILAAAGRKP